MSEFSIENIIKTSVFTGWIVLILLWVYKAITERGKKAIHYKKSAWTPVFIFFIFIIVFTIILTGKEKFFIYSLGYYGNIFTEIFGFIMLCIGFSFIFIGRINLGRNWSYKAAILSDHELQKDGIYSNCRHPIYFGFLLFYTSQGFIFHNWLVFVLSIFLVLPYFLHKAKIEEKLMESHFGSEFIEYKKNAPMFIPRFY